MKVITVVIDRLTEFTLASRRALNLILEHPAGTLGDGRSLYTTSRSCNRLGQSEESGAGK